MQGRGKPASPFDMKLRRTVGIPRKETMHSALRFMRPFVVVAVAAVAMPIGAARFELQAERSHTDSYDANTLFL